MTISRFLRDQAFDPGTLKTMGEVYEKVRVTIGLADRNDPLNVLVAERVIELAQQGIRTPTALYMMTVERFKHNPQ